MLPKYKFNCDYFENANEPNDFMEYDKESLDLLLCLFDLKSPKLSYNKFLDLKYSLVPNWMIRNPDKSICLENEFIPDFDKPKPKPNVKNIFNGINSINQINEFIPDYPIGEKLLSVIGELESNGVIFDMKFTPDYTIKINSQEVIFPICCVGKNRSQYLFYYLKNLQALHPNNFEVGYPSSGDELSVLADNQSNCSHPNKNVLSSFLVKYKKDNFSISIGKSFGLVDSDGNFLNVSRAIHTFDKVLKKEEWYKNTDIKNYEDYKYSEHLYEIFGGDENNLNYNKIKELYIKYFLHPTNLLKVINFNTPTKITKITYVCLSDKSFYNLCICFSFMKKKYPEINLRCVRIVYFGHKDIFQKSNIKDEELLDYKKKFIGSFQFVK